MNDKFEVFEINKSTFWKDNDGDLFIKVPISGIVTDRQGDTVSKSCGDDMIEQLNSGIIPFYGNHGFDKNGNKIYDWKDVMGKMIKGEWADNEIDILATIKLNKENPDAVTFFKYGKQKMPLGFSIGGDILKIKEVDY